MQPECNVAIIGTAFAGIGMALRLKRDGGDSFILLSVEDYKKATARFEPAAYEMLRAA